MNKNIGFISTRFAGVDGVSMEAGKWAEVFTQNGHSCFWFGGLLDRDDEQCFQVPEAYFKDARNEWINERIFGRKNRSSAVSEVIHDLRSFLKQRLHEFIRHYKIDLIIAENILTIPMHVPLGLALTETIAETQIPTIAHHHDFYWERSRFSVNAIGDYLRMAFPPNLPNIVHVVINTEAQEQLAFRTGVSSVIIPNVLDFENPPNNNLNGAKLFRESIGLKPDDRIILQPTRIVKRKGIEHAIELVKELKDPRNKLVISHEAGDEGYEYQEWLTENAQRQQVDLRLVNTLIDNPWAGNDHARSEFSLWDIYPYADFITYPSHYEGFGNAFLEAVYFRKPILINRYSTFIKDIEPLGFEMAVMDGFLSKKTVETVKELLESPVHRERAADLNYEIAARHYSFALLRNQLNVILSRFFGDSVSRLSAGVQKPTNKSYFDFKPRYSEQESFPNLDNQAKINLLQESAIFIQRSLNLEMDRKTALRQ